MARNAAFDFRTPRFFTAYADSVLPFRLFVDGRSRIAALDMGAARSFFQDSQFPHEFHRREGAFGIDNAGLDVTELQKAHPVTPGHNDGTGNYVTDPSDLVLLKGVRPSLQRPSRQTTHTWSVSVGMWLLRKNCWRPSSFLIS